MTERVSDAPTDSVATIFAAARDAGRHLLSEVEAKAALGAAGVPVTPTRAASSAARGRGDRGGAGLPGRAEGRLGHDHAQERHRRRGAEPGRRRRGVGGLRAHRGRGGRGGGGRGVRRRVGAADGGAGHGGDHGHDAGPAVRAGADVRPGRRAGRGAEGRGVPRRAAGAARRRRDDPRDPGLPGARGLPRDAAGRPLGAGVDPAVAVGVRGGAPRGAGARPEPDPGPRTTGRPRSTRASC